MAEEINNKEEKAELIYSIVTIELARRTLNNDVLELKKAVRTKNLEKIREAIRRLSRNLKIIDKWFDEETKRISKFIVYKIIKHGENNL